MGTISLRCCVGGVARSGNWAGGAWYMISLITISSWKSKALAAPGVLDAGHSHSPLPSGDRPRSEFFTRAPSATTVRLGISSVNRSSSAGWKPSWASVTVRNSPGCRVCSGSTQSSPVGLEITNPSTSMDFLP